MTYCDKSVLAPICGSKECKKCTPTHPEGITNKMEHITDKLKREFMEQFSQFIQEEAREMVGATLDNYLQIAFDSNEEDCECQKKRFYSYGGGSGGGASPINTKQHTHPSGSGAGSRCLACESLPETDWRERFDKEFPDMTSGNYLQGLKIKQFFESELKKEYERGYKEHGCICHEAAKRAITNPNTEK